LFKQRYAESNQNHTCYANCAREQIPVKKCNEIENGRESEAKNVSIVVHAKPNDPCCVMGE